MRRSVLQKMEERIRNELKDSKPGEVEILNLDNVRTSELAGLSDEYVSLKQLSLINVGLTSLQGLPSLPALEKLEMADNKLFGGLDVLTKCPSLREINLAGNRIATFDDLKQLSGLKGLVSLDLLDCPITQQEGYREKVFALLPSLEALDGLDRSGEEVVESDSEDDEEAEDSGSDEEPGLDYLQKELGSDSSSDEDDYDPDRDADNAPDDDDIIPSSDDEDGPSSSKKPRLDPAASKPPPSPPSDSD